MEGLRVGLGRGGLGQVLEMFSQQVVAGHTRFTQGLSTYSEVQREGVVHVMPLQQAEAMRAVAHQLVFEHEGLGGRVSKHALLSLVAACHVPVPLLMLLLLYF